METLTIISIVKIIKKNYQGLFQKGFTKEDFEKRVGSMDDFSSVLM